MLEQAGCLPVRGKHPNIEVLLVSSRYSGEWIAPKGSIEAGESPEAAALREVEEEAGVRGRIVRHLGRFLYSRAGQPAAVEAYELEVREELDQWLECRQRRRGWFALADALRQVQRPEVVAMLRALACAE